MPSVESPLTRRLPAAWSYRLALGLSYVVSPLILPPVLFGLALGHVGATSGEIARAVSVGLVFFGLLPLAYVVSMVQRGAVLSVDIRDRTRRVRPFLFGLASYFAGLVIMTWMGGTGTRLVAALMLCHILNTLLLVLVTLRWKISVHNAAVAGFASMLWFVARMPWPGADGSLAAPFLTNTIIYPVILLIPLLMWARVRAGVHTRAQVLAGALFGLVAPYAELYLAWRLGWL